MTGARRRMLSLVAALLAGGLAQATPTAANAAPIIRHIEIVREAPFDLSAEAPKGKRIGDRIERGSRKLFGAGNRLTILSREEVLRRELLIHEGEPLDDARVAETLRVLKELVQIADARVEIRPVAEDPEAVDVVFTLRNQFPLGVELEIRYEGDQPELDIPLTYDNVLGLHHAARLDLLRDLRRTGVRDLYGARRIGGTGWDLQHRGSLAWLNRGGALDGYSAGFVAARPFRSVYDPWRVGILADAVEGSESIYEGRDPRKPVFTPEGRLLEPGEPVPAGSVELPAWGYRFRRRTAGAVVERSFGTEWKLGVGAFADAHTTRERHLPEVADAIVAGSAIDRGYRAAIFPLPEEDTAGLLLTHGHPHFVEMFGVDGFEVGQYELDGYLLGIAVGRADDALGADDPFFEGRVQARAGLNAARWLRFAARGQVYSRRLDRGVWAQTLASTSGRMYLLAGPRRGSIVLDADARGGFDATGTLVGREVFDTSQDAAPIPTGALMDYGDPGIGGFDVHDRPAFPFNGGAETGFRAFENNAFVGDRFARGSVEARTPSVRKWSSDWGVVMFYEAGKVYREQGAAADAWERAPLLQDVGAGVRIQVVGAFAGVLRIDGAWRLSGPRDGASRIPINFGAERTF